MVTSDGITQVYHDVTKHIDKSLTNLIMKERALGYPKVCRVTAVSTLW